MGVCYDSVLVCGWAEGMDDGGSGENWSRWGRGGGGIREMASVASEADRSLAKVSIAILAVCMLTT